MCIRDSMETDVQKLTDKYTKEIDKICEAKNKEIMELSLIHI